MNKTFRFIPIVVPRACMLIYVYIIMYEELLLELPPGTYRLTSYGLIQA